MIAKKNNKVEIDISSWFSLSADLDADCRGWFLNLSIHFLDKGSLPEDNEKLAVLANVKFSEFQRFSEVVSSVILPLIQKLPVKKAKNNQLPLIPKETIIPNVEEVINYFILNGYSKELAEKAFKYYETGNWKDSNGKQVKNWKQKMQSVWFKESNKQQFPSETQSIILGRMTAETALKNANNFNNVTIPD